MCNQTNSSIVIKVIPKLSMTQESVRNPGDILGYIKKFKILKILIKKNRILNSYILNFLLVLDGISSVTYKINNKYFY